MAIAKSVELIKKFEVQMVGIPSKSQYQRFVTAIENNYNLGDIDLPDWLEDDQCSPEYLQADFLKRLNCNGRNYLAQEQPDRRPGVDLLIAISNCLDALYFHLKENPDLCNIKNI